MLLGKLSLGHRLVWTQRQDLQGHCKTTPLIAGGLLEYGTNSLFFFTMPLAFFVLSKGSGCICVLTEVVGGAGSCARDLLWVERSRGASSICLLVLLAEALYCRPLIKIVSGKLAASDSLFNPRAKVVVQWTCCGLLTSLKCYGCSLFSPHWVASARNVLNLSSSCACIIIIQIWIAVFWLVCNFVVFKVLLLINHWARQWLFAVHV